LDACGKGLVERGKLGAGGVQCVGLTAAAVEVPIGVVRLAVVGVIDVGVPPLHSLMAVADHSNLQLHAAYDGGRIWQVPAVAHGTRCRTAGIRWNQPASETRHTPVAPTDQHRREQWRDATRSKRPALAKATQGQKDLRELRGYPGYKEALKTSADAIHKAKKQLDKAEKKAEKGR
jgi:hypothetical protein